MGYGESIVKAKSFELAVSVNFMNILLLKRKDILRVNSFAFYNFGSSKCFEAVNALSKTDFIHKLCIVQKNVMNQCIG
jgi:hypothetical protein